MASADNALVEKVMAYDIRPVVERYARDHKLSMDDARNHERELKRYFALVAGNPGIVYGMCGPIDELWHTFLTFTMLYEEFSQQVAQRFIHHFPNENVGDKDDSKERKQHYERFRKDYMDTFHEEPPRHLWPYAMETDPDILGCSTCRCCVALS
jgi:hypothetical protein